MPVVVGVDIGSITAKTVVMDAEARVLAYDILQQGMVNEEAARTCLQRALDKAALRPADPDFTITTGYGRDLVRFGDRSITEITCHAAGVHHLLPEVRTIIDVGGQDSKVIGLDEQGRVATFRMNDKCAAGTGRFLEVMARALEIELTELGAIALQSRQPAPVSSVCTVFAESEVVSLAARGFPKVDIVGGIHEAIAHRLSGMVRAVGLRGQVAMTGGVAKNSGVVRALERLLGVPVGVPSEPQIAGALGAALLALQRISPGGAVDGRQTAAEMSPAPCRQRRGKAARRS